MPREYTQNRTSQGAVADALRSYTPNQFTGSAGGTATPSPHLSVAAADRPYAGEIAEVNAPREDTGVRMFLGNREVGAPPPGLEQKTLDRKWQFGGPTMYSNYVAKMLRRPDMVQFLESKRAQPVDPNANTGVELSGIGTY